MGSFPLTPIGLLVGTLVAVGLMAVLDLAPGWGALLVATTTGAGAIVDYAKGRFS